MNTTNYTLLFCASLTLTYLLARSGRVRMSYVLVLGLVINSLTFSLFAMQRQHFIPQAALTGVQLSLIFTLLSVGLAYVFRVFSAVELSQQKIENIPAFVDLFLDR